MQLLVGGRELVPGCMGTGDITRRKLPAREQKPLTGELGTGWPDKKEGSAHKVLGRRLP